MVTRIDKAGVVSTGSTTERDLEDRFSEVVNVKDYGAKGDGTTDDTAAIQAAVDTEAGRIFLPAGRYKMDSIVYVWPDSSNMVIEGEAGTVLLPRENNAFYVRGTETEDENDPWAGTALNSPPDYSSGDTNYETASAHGFVVGDFVWLMSSRNAFEASASATTDDWTLGNGTQGAPNLHFGEIIRVKTVPTTTTFSTYSPPVFQSLNYPANGGQIPSTWASGSETTSAVRKLTMVQNVHIRDINVEVQRHKDSVTTATQKNCDVFKFWRCYACSVENCHVDFVTAYDPDDESGLDDLWKDYGFRGAAVKWHKSLDCSANNITVLRGAWAQDAETMNGRETEYNSNFAMANYQFNTFVAIGGQTCGPTGCKVLNGSQAVDFTYSDGYNGSGPSIFCYADNCVVEGQQKTGMTTHPGCYGTRFTNNTIKNARTGIMNRAPFTTITGNIMSFDVSNDQILVDEDTVGVSLYQGWARNAAITGNTFKGFHVGVAISDRGSDVDEQFTNVNATITGNSFFDCSRGVWRQVYSGSEKYPDTTALPPASIVISGNTFRNLYDFGICFDGISIDSDSTGEYLNGSNVTIQGNTFDTWTGSPPDTGEIGFEWGGILLRRIKDFTISGNSLHEPKASGITISECQNGTITGNSVRISDTRGGQAFGMNLDETTKNISVAGNSLRSNTVTPGSGGYTETAFGIYINEDAENINLSDNIIDNFRTRVNTNFINNQIIMWNLPTGSSEPAGLFLGQLWVDTNDNYIRIRREEP